MTGESVDTTSAIQVWADEADLAEALGSFGDGYRHAQRDAQVALGRDRLAAREVDENARQPGSILSPAELRELYSKSLYTPLKLATGWHDADGREISLAEATATVVHAVLSTRDRELTRNRQRLALAADSLGRHEQDERLQAGFDAAREAQVRREERLKVLDEVAQVLREENQTPYDTIALSGPMARLKKMRRDAEKGLDSRPKS